MYYIKHSLCSLTLFSLTFFCYSCHNNWCLCTDSCLVCAIFTLWRLFLPSPSRSFFFVLFSVQQRKWIEWKTIFFSLVQKKKKLHQKSSMHKKRMPRLLSNNWFKQHFKKEGEEQRKVQKYTTSQDDKTHEQELIVALPNSNGLLEMQLKGCAYIYCMAWMWRCLGCACLKLVFLLNSAVCSIHTRNTLFDVDVVFNTFGVIRASTKCSRNKAHTHTRPTTETTSTTTTTTENHAVAKCSINACFVWAIT